MLDALATPVGIILRTIHDLVTAVGLPSASGWAWGLSIVLLTVTVRLVLFPLFVKQIKSQRRMQEIAPMVKELQKKHKGDRETLNTELMKLYKDNNANPVAGCLPLLLQLPVFFALFHVIREFGPGAPEDGKFGLSAEQLEEGGKAKIFGAPVAANFRSSEGYLAELGASSVTTVRVVAAIMVVLMGATTYWTQRQMIARSGTTDPQQIMIQKFLLYVLPFSFAISGVIFPIGVLLYWVTTNVWSMGQQAYVIKRMPPPVRPGEKPAATDKAVDGKATGKTTDGKATGKATDGKATGKTTDGKTPGGKTPDGKTSGGKTPGGKTPGGKTSGGKTTTAGTAAPDGAGAPDGKVGSGSGHPSAAAEPGPGSADPARPPRGGRSGSAPKGRAAGSRRNKNRKGGRR